MSTISQKTQRRVTSIRLEETLITEIDKTAKALGVSRNDIIEMFLRMGVMRSEKQ
jgi:metal-responsive CopG/Arc/MetJ family transcriptional regulator